MPSVFSEAAGVEVDEIRTDFEDLFSQIEECRTKEQALENLPLLISLDGQFFELMKRINRCQVMKSASKYSFMKKTVTKVEV